jgi:1,2-diacylglycerol 3-alpha-glucosyltransferase
MKKLKIGFFTDTYTPQFNGVVTSIESFRKELEEQGHEVYVFAPTPNQKTDSKRVFRFHSVRFIFYPGIRVAMPYSQKAYEAANKIKLDIVHTHSPFSLGLFGFWIAKKFKLPYIHTYHTLYPDYVHYLWKTKITQKLAEKLSRDFCNQCDSIISPSTKITKTLKKWGTKKDISTIATGINFKEIKSGSKKDIPLFRKKYGIEENEKIVLFLSRIAKEKNIDLLLGVAKKLRNKDIKFLIVGDGPYKKEVEQKANKQKLDKVIFTGFLPREEVPIAYRSADVFAFPSTSETQGLVVAEAMTVGLPIVAIKDLAIGDMVIDNYNGYLTNKNVKDFSSKIEKVLSNKKINNRFSENSIKKVKEFSIKKKTRDLVKLYIKEINKNIAKNKNIS